MVPIISPVSFRPRTKRTEVCEALTRLANGVGPGGKLPTVTQLCNDLGVSLATLTKALDELEAAGTIKRLHGKGIFAVGRTTRNICVICAPEFWRGAMHSPFWDILLQELNERVGSHRAQLRMHFASSGGAQAPFDALLMGELAAGEVDGVIGLGISQAAADWLHKNQVPLVHYASSVLENAPYFAYHDGIEIVRSGLAALRSLGAQRLGLWMPVQPFVARTEKTHLSPKIDAYFAFHEEEGLSIQQSLVRTMWHLQPQIGDITTQGMQEQGYWLAHTVFSEPRQQWPDGILILDDLMTRGALTALGQLGVQIGVDLQVTTISNLGSPVLLGHEGELILLQINPVAYVEALLGLLETLMGGQIPQPPSVCVQFKVQMPKTLALTGNRF